jgi:hypothetical protein
MDVLPTMKSFTQSFHGPAPLVESAYEPTIHDVSTSGRAATNENGQKCKKKKIYLVAAAAAVRGARCTLQLTGHLSAAIPCVG